MVFLLQRKMAQVVCPETRTSGWVWFALVVAIIALIMVIVIYVFYFAERENFLRVLDPTWNTASVTSSDKTIAGENFTLYTITDNAGVAQGDVVTLNTPEGGSAPGAWFIVSNQNDKTVTVQAGTGVTFQSFPVKQFIAIPTGGISPPPLVPTAPAAVGLPAAPAVPATNGTPIVINGGTTGGNVSLLPAKTSWIIAWLNTEGTALNLVPGGVSQS